MLNTMLQGVVLNGTGKAAQLDFTYSVGKTGTSSNYRDAWFIGFTGQYVAGVWLGNDDFTPMSRVTGGSFPAQTWHNFMVMAHDTDNIPADPGHRAASRSGGRAGTPRRNPEGRRRHEHGRGNGGHHRASDG